MARNVIYSVAPRVNPKDYDVSLIQKAHINFRPGLALSGILTGLTYKKVSIKAVKKETAEEGSEI